MNFLDVREEYKKQREDMRKDLAEYLNGIDTELRIVSGARAGKGWTKYTSDRRIAEYDLSNWKWVEITDDQDFEYSISKPTILELYSSASFFFSLNKESVPISDGITVKMLFCKVIPCIPFTAVFINASGMENTKWSFNRFLMC